MKKFKITTTVEVYVEADTFADAKDEFECENYMIRNEQITDIREVTNEEYLQALAN